MVYVCCLDGAHAPWRILTTVCGRSISRRPILLRARPKAKGSGEWEETEPFVPVKVDPSRPGAPMAMPDISGWRLKDQTTWGQFRATRTNCNSPIQILCRWAERRPIRGNQYRRPLGHWPAKVLISRGESSLLREPNWEQLVDSLEANIPATTLLSEWSLHSPVLGPPLDR